MQSSDQDLTFPTIRQDYIIVFFVERSTGRVVGWSVGPMEAAKRVRRFALFNSMMGSDLAGDDDPEQLKEWRASVVQIERQVRWLPGRSVARQMNALQSFSKN